MQGSTLTLVLYMAVFFGIMYFFMIRPQQKQAKQRQAMLSSLRANDKVMTSGGIYGKVKKVKDNTVIVQIADKVEIEVAKAGIASIENREVVVEKDKKSDKKDKIEAKEEKVEEQEPEQDKATGTTEG
jgi:preprotein translocase subunit YajC